MAATFGTGRLTGRGRVGRPDARLAVAFGDSCASFFIFVQAFAVSGAQAADVLATAIDRAREHVQNPDAAVLSA